MTPAENNSAKSDFLRKSIEAIRDLPTLPVILLKIVKESFNPEASALDLAKHIAMDQSLSASLLRIVNSAYFGFHRRISNVLDAIVLLGFSQVRDLALATTAFKSLSSAKPSINKVQLWRHAIATAIACERLARFKRCKEHSTFYTAGLLHDLGKVVLDITTPTIYGDLLKCAQLHARTLFEVEKDVLGFTHAEAGALLGEHWNLPQDLIGSIRFHHEPGEIPSECTYEDLIHCTALADYITYLAGLGENSNGRPPDKPDASFNFLGVSLAECERMARTLLELRDRINAMVGVLAESPV